MGEEGERGEGKGERVWELEDRKGERRGEEFREETFLGDSRGAKRKGEEVVMKGVGEEEGGGGAEVLLIPICSSKKGWWM